MKTVIQAVNAEVLSNRGVPVFVHKLDENGKRVTDDVGEPVRASAVIRLNAYLLACIEDTYGDMQGYQAAMEAKPNRTLVDTLALIWDAPAQQVGLMMLDGAQNDYATALMASLMIANGMEVDGALKVLESGVKQAREQMALMSKALDEALESDQDDTSERSPEAVVLEAVQAVAPKVRNPGRNGSGTGSRRAVATTSSGT